MFNKSFKDFLALSGPDRPKSPPKSRAQRLAEVTPPIRAELLEARRMFAVTASSSGGVITVTGDSAANDIDVWYDGDRINVWVNQNPLDDFDDAGITRVDVYGQAGDDTITCNGNTQWNLPVACRLFGEDGDDLAYGTDNADTIYGGVGYDTVRGWDGADLVYGGTGSGDASDALTGFDLLYGGTGNDTVRGEGGGDTIYGGAGADSLLGGDGSDWIEANDPVEMGVHDILDGGSGTDCGWWSETDDTDSNMEGNLA